MKVVLCTYCNHFAKISRRVMQMRIVSRLDYAYNVFDQDCGNVIVMTISLSLAQSSSWTTCLQKCLLSVCGLILYSVFRLAVYVLSMRYRILRSSIVFRTYPLIVFY